VRFATVGGGTREGSVVGGGAVVAASGGPAVGTHGGRSTVVAPTSV
jgi:hypothetical protein